MKNCFRVIGVIICLHIAYHKGYAQAYNVDSLKKVLATEKEDTNKVNTLNLLCYYEGDFNRSIQCAKDAISIAEKIDFKKGMGTAYNYIGLYYINQSNYNECLKNFLVALQIRKETGIKKDIAESYLNLGSDYIYLGIYAEALSNTYNSLKIYQEIGDKKNSAECLLTLSEIYIGQSNTTEALRNMEEALKIQQETGDTAAMARAFAGIGIIYGNTGKYNDALKSFDKASAIYKELGDRGPRWGMLMCHESYGYAFEKLGDSALKIGDKAGSLKQFHSSFDNYLESLNGWLKIRNPGNIAQMYNHLGDIELKLKQFQESKKYFQKSLELSISTGNKETISHCYQGLASLDSIDGNYEQAYGHYQKYILYRDSIMNEESTKKSVQTRMQYEFDKKESIAKAAQDKKDADAKRIKSQQYFAIAALGVVVLAVVIIALIQFRNNKQKQKANNLITKQKQQVETTLTELKSTQAQLIQSEKMASLGELTAGIAHEIQNPLNFVNNFSEVNKELIEELKSEKSKVISERDEQLELGILNDLAANEEKINHHGKRADAIVKGMLQHSRQTSGQKEPTNINALADEYLRLAFHGMRAKDKDFNATLTTEFDESVGNINIIPQEISRVLLNLYNNAFYAVNEKVKQQTNGYDPTISVATKKAENRISITVSDNGNGIPQKVIDKIFQPFFTTKPTGEGTGLGLSLVYDIITKEHNGTIKVESKEGEGSTFIINLPIK